MTTDSMSKSSAEPVTVKPLEWTGPDVGGDRHARSVLCVYTIRKQQGSMGYWLTEVGGYHTTVEAAKAAAQSDYEARILSALSSQAQTTGGERNAVIEECAKVADRFGCGVCGMDGKTGEAIRALKSGAPDA